MIYALDEDYNIMQINKRGCEILGYDDDKDIVGRNWVDDFIPEKYKGKMKTTLDKVMSEKNGIIEYNENPVLTKNGEERILSWQDTLIKDENGTHILTSGEDITERKILTEYNENFKALFDSFIDGVIMVNNIGNIDWYNEAFAKMFGYAKEEIIGKNLHQTIAPKKYHKMSKKGFKNFKVNGKGLFIGKTLELFGMRKNGIEFPIELSLSPFNIDKKWNAIAIVRDITSKKKAEELIIRQREELSDFSHIIAHDIRNPLQVLKGYAELLKGGDGAEFGAKIIKKAEEIDEFIRRSLELADAGKIIGTLQDTDINELVRDIAKNTIPDSIDFTMEHLPTVKGDAHRYKQIFQNLLLNAVEHGNPSRVAVRYKKKGDWHTISVEDDGKGIPLEEIKNIFKKKHTTSPSNSGLGLAIVKKIVEAYNGKINVESGEGKGTIFTIMLPIAPNFQE